MSVMIGTKRAKKLDAIYAKIPNIECKQLCQSCCTGTRMEHPERHRIFDAIDGEPVKGFAQNGFIGYRVCPVLSRGQCTIHAIRPAICRLYGVVESMPCPHGCVPERVLTDEEGFKIFDEIRALK